MADEIPISQLPAVVTPATTDILPIVQGGVTYKETVAQLISAANAAVGPAVTVRYNIAYYDNTTGNLLGQNNALHTDASGNFVGNSINSTPIGNTTPSSGAFTTLTASTPINLASGGTNANLTATINNLVYSTASAMALLPTANNGVLVTSAGGIPSISSTLPSGLTIPGFVVGPASATDHGIVRYDGTTGTLVEDSQVLIDDSNNVTGIVNLTVNGIISIPSTTSSTVGVINKAGTPFIHTYGASQNLFIGSGAGNFTLTGASNIGMGVNSLNVLTSGTSNAGYGWETFLALTTGSQNVAIGRKALNTITTGANNIAVGFQAGSAYTTSESSNICIGNNGTVGESNVMRLGTFGSGAGQVNTTVIAGNTTLTSIQNTPIGSTTPSTGAFTTLSATTPIALSSGGTNASLTANNGGIVWSNATQLQILAGTSTANQVLLSGSTATPAWSTATYPATTTVNQILYSNAANTITGLATANSSVLVTSAGGVPSLSTTLPSSLTIPSATLSTLVTMSGGQVVNKTDVTTATYTTLSSDFFIAVNRAGTVAITLIASPTTGQMYRIKDKSGAAASNNITITPSAGNIDGSANYVINTNFGSIDLIYNGTSWSIL